MATGARAAPPAPGRPRRPASRRRRPRRRPRDRRRSPQQRRLGLLDRDVVQQRDRLGADADQVVDVHRDAVDPDRVEAPRLLGDDHLRADAVGRQRDPDVRREHARQPHHAGVMAGQRHRQRLAPGLDRLQHARRSPPRPIGLVSVHTRCGVCVAHALHSHTSPVGPGPRHPLASPVCASRRSASEASATR